LDPRSGILNRDQGSKKYRIRILNTAVKWPGVCRLLGIWLSVSLVSLALLATLLILLLFYRRKLTRPAPPSHVSYTQILIIKQAAFII
jgi:hypothetical protein